MLLGALAALAQDDLKRVLAWSTVSQLAYMAGGLATGGYTAGLFHLLTHAAFKALLFLGAGSVLRTVGTNLMSEMGGLWRRMPVTFATTLVGGARAGGDRAVRRGLQQGRRARAPRTGPPRTGRSAGTASWVAWLVYLTGLATVVVTAAYVTRMVARTFLGSYRGRAELHESPAAITGPLVVLATFTVALGLPVLPHSYGVASWFAAPAGARAFEVSWSGAGADDRAGADRGRGSWLRRSRATGGDPVPRLGRAYGVLQQAFHVDDLYDAALVRPVGRSPPPRSPPTRGWSTVRSPVPAPPR